MTSREEPFRRVDFPTFPTLSWVMVCALVCGVVATDFHWTQAVYAEETQEADEEPKSPKNPDASDNDSDSKKDTAEKVDREQDADDPERPEQVDKKSQDEPEKKSEKKNEAPPADSGDAEEPVSDKEQEKAEKAAGDKVSEAEEAADQEEDARAAAEEAAGAEVEIDESGDEEQEPVESVESEKKPDAVDENKPDKETPVVQKRVIGATATIMEKQSELLFRARVDSGAKSCSLHIEDYKIENEEELMADNIGKVVRFHIKNGNNESHWLEAKIAGYVIVKTAAHRERRYKVPLTLRYKDFEKTVLVTLNNREKMEFPLLLGRNFLMGDFVVDVEEENNELHTR